MSILQQLICYEEVYIQYLVIRGIVKCATSLKSSSLRISTHYFFPAKRVYLGGNKEYDVRSENNGCYTKNAYQILGQYFMGNIF